MPKKKKSWGLGFVVVLPQLKKIATLPIFVLDHCLGIIPIAFVPLLCISEAGLIPFVTVSEIIDAFHEVYIEIEDFDSSIRLSIFAHCSSR